LTDENLQRTRRLEELADDCGVTSAQLALAWILAQDEITSVITGASKVRHLESNLGALEVDVDADLEAELDDVFS